MTPGAPNWNIRVGGLVSASKEELRQVIVQDLMQVRQRCEAVRAKMVALNSLAASTVDYGELVKMETRLMQMGSAVSRWSL